MRPGRRPKRWAAGFVIVAVALIGLAVGLAAPALAQSRAVDAVTGARTGEVSRSVIVEFGDPVRVEENERVQTVVSIGGDVTVAGTVTETIVTVGGDVTLESTANVGTQVTDQGDSIVLVNGTLTRQPGAEVTGNIQRVDVGNLGDVVSWASDRDAWRPFAAIGSFVGWLVMTVVFLLLGLIAAAAMPGQLRSAGRSLHLRPAGALGWGALMFFVIVPLSLLLLIITIVGILVVIPAAIALPFAYFFATLVVGTYVVERLLGAQLKGNLLPATAIAVVATSLVTQIPFLGGLVLLAMMVVGTGSMVLAIGDWRRRRRALRAAASAGDAAYSGSAAVTSGTAPAYRHPPYGAQPQGPYGAQPQGPYAAQPQGPYGAQPPVPYAAQPQEPYPSQTSAAPTQGQPPYGQLPHAQPTQGQPPYGAPAYEQPVYGQPQQPYSVQAHPPQAYAPPYVAPGAPQKEEPGRAPDESTTLTAPDVVPNGSGSATVEEEARQTADATDEPGEAPEPGEAEASPGDEKE